VVQGSQFERRLRLGVTELTAMTWMPRLVDLIQQCYPKVVIEPDVDDSTKLSEKLMTEDVGLIIPPEAVTDTRFVAKVIGRVESTWMCKPGLIDASRRDTHP
jgi:DNA-binding transcriptional LysR family regulator